MRKHVKKMNATAVRHKEFVDLLRALLSDEEFVRVLAEQGITTMPRLLAEHTSGMVGNEAHAVANLREDKSVDNQLTVLSFEAATLLSGHEMPAMAIAAIRSMSPGRQIED
ncbi:hypothetical protein KZJ38_21560 [Paraburkholderia edwinii]|uniref:Uncharacterized protein n=1 Tax=Paraburkholderia edwinii TaxID=2861782 RepID=A0ABX8UJ84_9BURK|nr:hypothetical protein [Paraburkholderia edwinii]QYD68771.1 hypothetical protein KZJ38_21560 [Paraburkholderia edwinii]